MDLGDPNVPFGWVKFLVNTGVHNTMGTLHVSDEYLLTYTTKTDDLLFLLTGLYHRIYGAGGSVW